MSAENEDKVYTPEELKKLPYMNMDLNLEGRVDDLLSRLTFREKCMLSAGEEHSSPPPIPRLGIPTFKMTDGPHGVTQGAVKNSPYYATGTGVAASTYFPTGIQQASTFNPDLIYKFGQAIAEETRAAGRSMILGPAFNICRSPMNGRTFEYYSEDPYLAGELAVSSVKGIQSKKIAPCIKHFVANNFESNRFKVNAVISQRALEEIYFPAFKKCVEKADPWGLMSSYNKINGIYVSEHYEILRKILKDKWKFSGAVVSDWGATHRCTSVENMVKSGLDIEMGSRNRFQIDLMESSKAAGTFPEEEFDDNIRRILRMYLRVGAFDDPSTIPEGHINTPEHQALAREMAEEGMVLLKNENNLLPLDQTKIKKIALLGKHADTKFGRAKLGGGSSAVLPPYEITIRQGLEEKCGDRIEIVNDPSIADVAIVCIGLEHGHDFKGGDHEGSDRLRYGPGLIQSSLVKKALKANKNTIVILVNGSPFRLEEFEDSTPAILEAWYGGLEIGHVVADILFGDVNPSGKLPVSWPKIKKDIPNTLNFIETVIPQKEVVYTEDIFIGYRHFDTNNIEPRFCFGHGLSYTHFKFQNLQTSANNLRGDEKITVNFEVSNVGERAGAEIPQLYIKESKPSVPRPEKELKGFQKIVLKPQETKSISFEISKEDLSYYSEEKGSWVVNPGEFEILIGYSSRGLPLSTKIEYRS